MAVIDRVYLDTKVPSAYYDDRAPDRQRLTQEFWQGRCLEMDAVISTITLLEIRNTPNEDKRQKMENLVQNLTVLNFSNEADNLAQEYVRRGIFPGKFASDANHVAIAVVHGIGYLASWNFRHLVRVNTRREVSLVNALEGYNPIEIVAPPEL
ncbi:MAG: type II toxin-antitoxin system VapC family toxin [Gemmatimonadetes bacterium]|nr:type II toxin-antitoxin system VapC family toxin [Gemmatimonadota bacterium]MYB66943.1 type II toxin-antitoxin system VapC family toxin [Gemmatimonadota bacterium]